MINLINKHLTKIVWILGFINIAFVIIFKPDCPWKKYFNIDCAGCGATRMFEALFKLDIYQAFRFNPLLFIILIIFIIYGIYILISKLFRKKYYVIKERDWLILLIIVIIYMILRNIEIFNYLKPTVV